jgi:ABC-type lipoprotein export system ATPase subunit
MNENVFEIRDIECAYAHNGKTVLTIGDLNIPKGKITTILGKSGSGKSTFLETLGMMNHTIQKGSIRFTSLDTAETIDQNFWKKPDSLSLIRNKHFSFIFQDDFLMPYYTPWENMLIGKLIQNASRTKVKHDTLKDIQELELVCAKLGLDINLLKKQMPYEMSGGQKQRLSFSRAIAKEYSVIFGDEPTGNLDEDSSAALMEVLRISVHEKPDRAAILVSHNIDLSISSSDRIIVLSPGKGTAYQVLPVNVFDKTSTGWVNGDKQSFDDIQMAALIKDIIRFKPV